MAKNLPGKYENINPDDIKTQEDFERLVPFCDKQDLRNAYPLGLATVPEEDIIRIHSSSGTTGAPVIIPYTQKDVDDWAIQFARCYEMAGITKNDRIQITPGYGLWTAGIGFQAGCEKLGAMAVPMGPGNTEKQLQMMQDLQSTVLCATSSYALLLAEEIVEYLLDPLYDIASENVDQQRCHDLEAELEGLLSERGEELVRRGGADLVHGFDEGLLDGALAGGVEDDVLC